MSNAERQRRYRETHGPLTAQAAPRPSDAESERLKRQHAAEIADLKAEIASLKAAQSEGTVPDEEAAVRRLARDNEKLRHALATAEAKLAADPGEVGKLVRQLKAARTRIENLTAESRLGWEAARANTTRSPS
jgi:hypothetical protein